MINSDLNSQRATGAMPGHQRIDLPGISFATAERGTLVERILDKLSDHAENATAISPVAKLPKPPGLLVGFINPHVYVRGTDPGSPPAAIIRNFLHRADYVCVDGVGIQLAAMLKKRRYVQRTVAEHLCYDVLSNIQQPVRALVIGAQPGVAEAAAEAMHSHNPLLEIVASTDGFQDHNKYRTLLKRHRDINLILIGAGSPKSERIALDAQTLCPDSVVLLTGGGTLGTWAGTKRRAPGWVSSCGVEWLHRMLFEPSTRARYLSGGWTFAERLLATNRNRASAAPATSQNNRKGSSENVV